FSHAVGRVFGEAERPPADVGNALPGDWTERARERLLDEPRQRLRQLFQRAAERDVAILADIFTPVARIGEKRRKIERRHRDAKVGGDPGERRAFERAGVRDPKSSGRRPYGDGEYVTRVRGQFVARPGLALEHAIGEIAAD